MGRMGKKGFILSGIFIFMITNLLAISSSDARIAIRKAEKQRRAILRYKNLINTNRQHYARGKIFLKNARTLFKRREYSRCYRYAKTAYTHFRKVARVYEGHIRMSAFRACNKANVLSKRMYRNRRGNVDNFKNYKIGMRYLKRAKNYKNSGRYDQAIKYANKAYEYLIKMQNKTGCGPRKIVKRALYKAWKQKKYVKKRKDHSSKNRFNFNQGKIYSKNAVSLLGRCDYKRALEYAEKAYEFFKKVKKGLGRALYVKANKALRKAYLKWNVMRRYKRGNSHNCKIFIIANRYLRRARQYKKQHRNLQTVKYADLAYKYLNRMQSVSGFAPRRRAESAIRKTKRQRDKIKSYKRHSGKNRSNFTRGEFYLSKAEKLLNSCSYRRARKNAERAAGYFKKIDAGYRKMINKARKAIDKAKRLKYRIRRYEKKNSSNRSYFRSGSNYLKRAIRYNRNHKYSRAFDYAKKAYRYFKKVR